MKILFIGPQGSGKSTQGKLLAEYLGLPYVSTGDIFREMSAGNSPEGKRLKQILAEGRLVDDETTSNMVAKKLGEEEYGMGFILDGYPRTLEQIKLFDPGFNKVIFLELPDEEGIKRLLERGREDDTKESITERLRLYHNQTDPILDYYRHLGILVEIDGTGSIDEIQQRIRDRINGQK